MSAVMLILGAALLGIVVLALLPWVLALLAIVSVGFLFVFWIFMLVSAIRNKGLTDGEKVGWVLAIIFFHFLGSLLYLFLGYSKRNRPLLAAA